MGTIVGVRVAIAGAGNVGQSIARSLVGAGHKVLLIERQRAHFRPQLVPEADWMYADACELSALQDAGIETAHVVIAATGQDRSNLVFAMLCKREFAVPRVVARVNEPSNQWLFNLDWGVDVAVSTPSTITAAVEEAVTTGDVVRLMTLQHGRATILEITLPTTSHLLGRPMADIELPVDAAVLAIRRADDVMAPASDVVLHAGDEIVLLAAADAESRVRRHLLRTV
jgi:trk system potassium uptake protein